MSVLTVVGSADAFCAGGRGHSCYLLEGSSHAPIMVDFGATALQGLRRLGKDPASLAGVVFTHMHGDHIGGLPYLLIDNMFNGARSAGLELLGPAGHQARLEALLAVTYGDVVQRKRDFPLTYCVMDVDGPRCLADLQIRAHRADHMHAPDRAHCLRITTPEGKIIAFSGDTAICDGLFEAAEGADLLICECSSVAPGGGSHCSWQELSEVWHRLHAKRIVLSHLGQDVRSQGAALLASAPASVNLALADDGMTLEV